MQEKRLRVGVIGVGYGAAVHLPALQQIPDVHVVAACAARLDRARDVTMRHQIPMCFDDYRRMFREAKLDAVTIATPPELHHPIAIAAAENYLHMLCEKPMARSAAEARDMCRLARDAGVQHAVDYQGRFSPAWSGVKQLIDEGYLGTFQSVSLTVYRRPGSVRGRTAPSTRYDENGTRGMLGLLGSDYVDALRWWFGEIHAVAGAASRARTPECGAAYSLILQFANGGTATVHLSAAAPVDLGDEIVMTGSDAMIAVQADGRVFGMRRGHRAVQELLVPERDDHEAGEGEESTEDRAPRFRDPRIGPFYLLAREWIRGILTGTGAAPTFEDGMKVHDVLDSVHRSQDLNRWVDTSGKKWPV